MITTGTPPNTIKATNTVLINHDEEDTETAPTRKKEGQEQDRRTETGDEKNNSSNCKEGDDKNNGATSQQSLSLSLSSPKPSSVVEGKGDSTVCDGEEEKTDSQRQEQQHVEQQQEEDDAMSLDVAYQALEEVRKLNLQIEFGGVALSEKQCVACWRRDMAAQHRPLQQEQLIAAALRKTKRPSMGTWIAEKRKSRIEQYGASPCLTCGTPVCTQPIHRSHEFTKQFQGTNLTICCACERFFNPQTTLDVWTAIATKTPKHTNTTMNNNNNKKELSEQEFMNTVFEVYDRTLLVFHYSVSFWETIIAGLEGNTSRHNYVGLGSSATGVVAGTLGVAAACTLLTPVGPPLLIASMLFGSSATAASAGSDVVNYASEPNKMADRIIVMYQLLQCLAVQLPNLIHASRHEMIQEMEHEHNNTNNNGDATNDTNNNDEIEARREQVDDTEYDDTKKIDTTSVSVSIENASDIIDCDKANTSATFGQRHLSSSSLSSVTTATSSTIPAVTTASSSTSKSLHVTRTITNIAKPLTGGLFSAVSIFTEAREFKKTVTQIRAGSPCEKAQQLRAINVQDVPRTDELIVTLRDAFDTYKEILQKYRMYRQQREEKEQLIQERAKVAGVELLTTITTTMDDTDTTENDSSTTVDVVFDKNTNTDCDNSNTTRKSLGWRFRKSHQVSTASITSTVLDDGPTIVKKEEETTSTIPIPTTRTGTEKTSSLCSTENNKILVPGGGSPPVIVERKFGWRIKQAMNRNNSNKDSSNINHMMYE